MEEFAINQKTKTNLEETLVMCYNTPTNIREAGNVAKERDYAREYQREKIARREKERMLGVKVTVELAKDFEAKCHANGMTRNAVLRSYIERYTYEGFDQTPPPPKQSDTPVGMLSLASWATKQGISRQRASILLKEGRIPCAIQKGRYWYVPEEFVLKK